MDGSGQHRAADTIAFVSYAHADRPLVAEDVEALRSAGHDVWYDTQVVAGSSWRADIAAQLRRCSIVLFYVSARSITSRECHREVSFALELKRQVVCVFIEEVELPDAFRLMLGSEQAIRAHHGQDERRRQVLEAFAGSAAPATDGRALAVREAPPPHAPPKLLVLPMQHLGVRAEAHIADGFTEELVAGLSRFPSLMVFGLGTTLCMDPASPPEVAGAELGAGYILHGTTRVVGAELVVRVFFTATRNSRLVWSLKLARPLSELLALEEEVRLKVLGSVEPEFLADLEEDIAARSTNLAHWEMVVKARQRFWMTTRDSTAEARALVSDAIRMDGSNGRAWALLAMTHMNDYWNGWSSDAEQSLRSADRTSRRALAVDPTEPWAHHARGTWSGSIGDFAQAEADLFGALDVNPYFAPALGDITRVRALAMNTAGATRWAERAIAASPRDRHVPLWYYWIALVHFVDADYTAALAWLSKGTARRPDWVIFPMLRIVCLALADDLPGAHAALRDADTDSVQHALRVIRPAHPFAREDAMERYMDGLAAVGIDTGAFREGRQ